MAFISNAINGFAHHNSHSSRGLNDSYFNPQAYEQPSYQYQQSYSPQPQARSIQQPHYQPNTPQLPQPWSAEWHPPSQRWFYINQQTGERTWAYPQVPPQMQPQPQQQYYPGNERGFPQQQAIYNTVEQRPRKSDHQRRNLALGIGAGVLGGALLDHEAHKVEERWDSVGHAFSGDSDYNSTTQYTTNNIEEIQQVSQQYGGGYNDGYNNVDNMPGAMSGYDDRYDGGYDDGYGDGYYSGGGGGRDYGYEAEEEDYYSSDSGY